MAADTSSSQTVTDEEAAADVHFPPGHAHPSDLTYLKVGAVLFVITVAEVLTYTFGITGPLLVVILIPMMVVKFGMVAAFFMHLRFDSTLFTRVFVAGIILAVSVYIVVLLTFHVFTRS